MVPRWDYRRSSGSDEPMEIDQIETFLAVAAFGGFHKAAEGLRMSQPCVSARMKALEQSLGVELFTRGRGALTLSVAGRVLKPHAEQLLRTAALARQAIQELQPSRGGALQIAAELTVCTYFLPDIIDRFRQTHPKVMINLRSGKADSKEILQMVLQGQAEIGLARSLYHPEVETVNLRTDPLILVGHSQHCLTRARRACLAQVAEWPLVFFDRGSIDWTLVHDLFRSSGLVPNAWLEVETIEAAKRMVQRGLGLTFIPRFAVSKEIRERTLVPIEIVDAEPMRHNLNVVHPRHRPLRAEACAFLGVITSVAGDGANATEPKKPSSITPQSNLRFR